MELFSVSVIKINDCQHVIIRDNILTHGDDIVSLTAGVYVTGGNCTIQDNYIFQEQYYTFTCGIALLDTAYNIISGNEITGYQYGIYTHFAGYNTFSNNHLHHGRKGIESWASDNNKILDNKIEYNTRKGLNFYYSYNNIISNNIISHNGDGSRWTCGMMLEGTGNYISDNEISYNNPTGIYITGAYNNFITRNNFLYNNGDGSFERYMGHAFFDYFPYIDGMIVFRGNTWWKNYWSGPLWFSKKVIRGDFYILFQGWPWYNFDWNAASEPYDI